MATKKIAIIVGTSRNPRVGLPITQYLQTQLQPSVPSTIQLDLLDIASHQLPWLDEPGIPMYITSTSQYAHAHTQAWSKLISSYAGFIFVTPQYNCGIPGVLKNNLDALYHEWTGKPALVVAYGARGGAQAAGNLKSVLTGLKMDFGGEGEHVELATSKVEGAMAAGATKGELMPELTESWGEEVTKLKGLFEGLVEKVLKKEEVAEVKA